MKIFGTDGIRGNVLKTLDLKSIKRVGEYLGHKGKRIIIGNDSRESKDLIRATLLSGLLLFDVDVSDVDLVSSPALSYLTKCHKFDYGIMISASHNPYYDNGIKIFNHEGEKLNQEEQEEIEAYLNLDIRLIAQERPGRYFYNPDLIEKYYQLIEKEFSDLKNCDIPFTLDLANGGTSKLTSVIMKRLNLYCNLINNQPNGININYLCGSLNLEMLKEEMIKREETIAAAFDGDGDRIIALKNNTVLDGNQLLYLFSLFDSSIKKAVVTEIANEGVIKALKKRKIKVYISSVGDHNVKNKMKENACQIGAEASGHLIYCHKVPTGDGLINFLYLLRVIKNKPELLDKIDYKKNYQIEENVYLGNKEEVYKALLEKKEFESIISHRSLNKAIIRMSGTENCLRIFLEGKDETSTNLALKKILSLLRSIS